MNPLAILALIARHRQLVTLVGVAVAAASIYVWWQSAEIGRQRAAADRASLISVADTICEAIGAPFRPVGEERAKWGGLCLAEARRVGAIEADLAKGSADALLAGLDERLGKEAADALLAAAYAQRAAQAAERMEAADAEVQGDVATGAWAGAVNDAAGLRD